MTNTQTRYHQRIDILFGLLETANAADSENAEKWQRPEDSRGFRPDSNSGGTGFYGYIRQAIISIAGLEIVHHWEATREIALNLASRNTDCGDWTDKETTFSHLDGVNGAEEPDTIPATDEMVRQYLETALWAETDEDGTPWDKSYSVNNFDPSVIRSATEDCVAFCRKIEEQLSSNSFDGVAENTPLADWMECDMDDVGHNFWLTRNAHGAGFWDGDYPESISDVLTSTAKMFGERSIYLGDDGILYMC